MKDKSAALIFEELSMKIAPEIIWKKEHFRGDSYFTTKLIYEAIAFCANIGGFIGLVQICRAFFIKKSGYKITWKFIDKNDKAQEITITNSTMEDALKLIESLAPNGEKGILIQVQENK